MQESINLVTNRLLVAIVVIMPKEEACFVNFDLKPVKALQFMLDLVSAEL